MKLHPIKKLYTPPPKKNKIMSMSDSFNHILFSGAYNCQQVLDFSPEREACIDFHLNRLPPDISNLSNLRILMLDTNQLSELPREISQLVQLERLSISNNHLRRLPDSFTSLQRMESIHAANNRFLACLID